MKIEKHSYLPKFHNPDEKNVLHYIGSILVMLTRLTMKCRFELDLKVALAMKTPDFLNVAFLLIGPVTPSTLFDLDNIARQSV